MSAHSNSNALVRVAIARRANLRIRLASTVIVAGGLHVLMGMHWAWAWAALYAAVQAVEWLVTAPIVENRDTPISKGRATVFYGLMFAVSAIFGSLAIPLFTSPNVYDPSVGALLLMGGVLNVIVVNCVSRPAVVIASIPHLSYLLIGPLLGRHIEPGDSHWLAWWGGVFLLISASVMAVLTLERAMKAEAAARGEAQRRQQEAEEAVAAKSAFVAMISHELRTPISAILAGAADIARTDKSAAGSARLIGDAGTMMRSLLDDLLDLAKLDAHRLEVETIPFDLRQLVLDVIRMWRLPTEDKGLRLRLEGAAFLPGWVEGDPTRVRQVLNNLISNAIKFTREGSITVRLTAEPGPLGHRIGLAVVDTGPGMTPEQLDRLFTPFDQLDAGTARNHGGTGLGLSISRQLARLMAGDLKVTSAPGEGAVFELQVTLPVVAAPAADAGDFDIPAAAASPQAPRAAAPRVLVVDDHAVNRQAIALILEPAGITPTSAASAEEALDILAREPFDVVMMDVYMPDMDGRDATRRLRAEAGPNQHAPVIAITASATAKDWQACRDAGMTQHVAKPIDPAALYAALEEALSTPPDPAASKAA